MHPLEVELSERSGSIVPMLSLSDFPKTGCDITTAAVRFPEHFTKKKSYTAVIMDGMTGISELLDRMQEFLLLLRTFTFTF